MQCVLKYINLCASRSSCSAWHRVRPALYESLIVGKCSIKDTMYFFLELSTICEETCKEALVMCKKSYKVFHWLNCSSSIISAKKWKSNGLRE